MTVSAPQDEQLTPERFMTRLVDRVFGYDFFLSYSRADGMHLPQRLKDRLEQAGFRVFLDQTEYVAGADLRRETRRQVLKSRKIVVIGRPGAFRSEWVRREVTAAMAGDVGPVILDLNGALAGAPADAPLASIARQRDWLRLAETLDDPDGEPSDRIVAELVRSFNHTRQETMRQRIFSIAALVLLITAAAALWQAWAAIQARDQAEAEQRRAMRALNQVQGTADRSVQALALRIRKTRETSAAAPQAPPCIPEYFPDYDAVAVTALKVRDGDAALKILIACLAIAEPQAIAGSDAPTWQKGAAVLHQRIGELSDPPERERHFREAVALWRELAKDTAMQPLAAEQLGGALARLGSLELDLGRAEDALDLYRETVSHLEPLAASEPARADLKRALSTAYQGVAEALLKLRKADEALRWADKDLQTYGDLAEIDRAAHATQRDVASSLDRRAQALDLLGRSNDSLADFKRGTELLDRAIAADTAAPSWHRDAAAMRENMGKLLGQMGKSDAAIDQFWRALQIREQLATSVEDPGWMSELTEAYRRSSRLMLQIDRVAEAREMAEQYLLAASIDADANKDKLTRMRRALGTVCWYALNDGKFERALWVGQRAVELSPQLDWVRLNYAHALMLSGDTDTARTVYRQLSQAAPDDAAGLRRQMREDFAVLRQRGHVHPLMAELEAGLTAVNAAAEAPQRQ
ncbi:TIR domain-containing protein [Bradyrhizobium ontarionense]|uniref:TIR domain-containing protein n=1 Tax=Bradyrhizobium ontarionense TaxID=2898149 RepID=A0ABY3RDJ3_9BRAD|nr:toll/interleukin-1 receptor domain-containing protein [Bradyrhizobium sp. A19]UFZ04758.1 TIR domain-containing protein [Bradyrhizobium sp. A19]